MNFRQWIVNVSKWSVYGGYQKLKHHFILRHAQQIMHAYLSTSAVKKLHVGAGGSAMEGWLNVDICPANDTVAYMDAAARFPFPNDTFDCIFSEHVFEHLNAKEQLMMLAECLRVLKPGGQIRIATPSLDAIASAHKKDPQFVQDYFEWSANVFYPELLEKFSDNVYDEVFYLNNYFYNWGHRFLHNGRSLKLFLSYVGYEEIRECKIMQSDIPFFQMLEKHGSVIPPAFNEFETMVFEAQKSSS